MSCVVGLVQDGVVTIGGDSIAIGHYDVSSELSPKVFRNGDLLLGVAGSFRMSQLLRYGLEPPFRKPDVDVMTYLVTLFADAVMDCFTSGRYPRKSDEEPNGAILIGYEGRLFVMHNDYSVLESRSGCYAIGAGDDVAHGALYATQGQSPHERIQTALEAAEEFNAAVRGPFVIVATNEVPL